MILYFLKRNININKEDYSHITSPLLHFSRLEFKKLEFLLPLPEYIYSKNFYVFFPDQQQRQELPILPLKNPTTQLIMPRRPLSKQLLKIIIILIPVNKIVTSSLPTSLIEVPIITCHWEQPENHLFVTEPFFPDGIDSIPRLEISFRQSVREKITVVPANPFG